MRRKGQLVRGILFVLILTAVLGVLLGAVRYWENHMMALPDAPERNESQAAAEKTDEPHVVNMLLVIRTPGRIQNPEAWIRWFCAVSMPVQRPLPRSPFVRISA